MGNAKLSYVGVDAHRSNCSICVVSSGGDVLFETECRSEPGQLSEVLNAIADPKDVVIEESTVADMLYRELHPLVHRMVVANPRENQLIAQDENLDDREAARKLAHLLRMGCIKPVHHNETELRYEFKRLVYLYISETRNMVQAKNRLKATFASYLVPCAGQEVYGQPHRSDWLDKLPNKRSRARAAVLLNDVDHALEQREQVAGEISRQSRQFPEIKRFQQVPGIGPIRAAIWYAVVDTPYRFASRAHLWGYCGLGIVRRKSSKHLGPQHLTRKGNPVLKEILKAAAVAAINKGDHNRFQRQFELLISRHKPEALARLTVARAIATALFTMWVTGEDYKDDHMPRPLR